MLTQRHYKGFWIGKRVSEATHVGPPILEKAIKRLVTAAKLKYQREIGLVRLLPQKENGPPPAVGHSFSNIEFSQSQAL